MKTATKPKRVHSFTRTISNLYGIPFFNAKVDAYVQKLGARLVFGVTNLKDLEPSRKPTVVIANLAFLVSAGIPILGYYRLPTGLWVRTSAPRSLTPNEVEVYGPSYSAPSSEDLEHLYRTGNVGVIEHKRFIRHMTITPEELNARVFGKKNGD